MNAVTDVLCCLLAALIIGLVACVTAADTPRQSSPQHPVVMELMTND